MRLYCRLARGNQRWPAVARDSQGRPERRPGPKEARAVADTSSEQPVEIKLTRAQAVAAGAVLRGYVEHQRGRLGDRAATNPNFQNVSAALHALEAQVGPSARA